MKNLAEASAYAINRARTLNYTAEGLLFQGISWLVLRKKAEKQFSVERLREINQSLVSLLERDSHAIAEGVYPISVLKPESPVRHFRRLPKLLWDGVWMERRRRQGKTTEFDSGARRFLDDVPRYYRRNFHFQTNGYLSRESAELYEHQVEILFRGAADAMRRMMIAPIKERLRTRDGQGLRFLEVGAGTGAATRFMRAAFPKAKIVATDLSEPYLKVAQERMKSADRVDYLQADGAALPFKDGTFDLVYSVFLFHELPEEERLKMLKEAHRVLVSGGCVAAVDSLQKGDHPSFDELLLDFPGEFHEPFYRNYLERPLKSVFEKTGFSGIFEDQGFFSKLLLGTKP